MSTEETALIKAETLDVAVLFTSDGMDKILEDIQKKVDDFQGDISTEAGRKEVASFAYKIARSKTLIDDLGKQTVSDLKAKIKPIDNLRKKARDFLDDLKEKTRKPLTDWEEEQERIRQEKIEQEEKRVAEIRQKIENIKQFYMDAGLTESSEQARILLDSVNKVEVTEKVFAGFLQEARKAKKDAIERIIEYFEVHQKREKEEAERKAEAERLEKIREEQEAERKRIEEENKKTEQERLAKEEEIRKEREAIERAQRELMQQKISLRENTLRNIGIYRAGFAGESLISKYEGFIISSNLTFSWNDVMGMDDDAFNVFVYTLEGELKDYGEKIEKERLEHEAKAKEEERVRLEKEAKEREERAAREKKEREEAEARERERQEALRPDKDKLIAWGHSIIQSEDPGLMKSPEAETLRIWAIESMVNLGEQIIEKAEAL